MTVHIHRIQRIRITCTISDKGVDSVSTSTAQSAAPAAAADESHLTGIDHGTLADFATSEPVFA
ncbi:hypothetical protein E3T61_17835 [Cryobacterium lactosi]|uniref:Uncharacterized protein n=1 Tax=Cryobacterium lactosi TaxID=1259202 RepID=A0A4R9BJG5_9MICO|nr:hypothetical protein [Cryobacterium lactosi]TFD85416.1 hypothetical protein E3T61_17835 [Cryobacterium lactosi]